MNDSVMFLNKSPWIEPTVVRLCPLCNGNETQIVSQKMQYGLDLTTVICNKCGMVFTNPLPNESTYNRFYTEAYANYYGHIANHMPVTVIQGEPQHITAILDPLEHFRPIGSLRLMEVGPGKGQFLFWAKQRGAEIQGIEPSPVFHEILVKSGLPSINGTLEDAASMGLETFDCIVMSHVLEHFYDPNRALDICRKLLADDGLLVIIVPNILKPYRSLDSYFLRYVHPSNFSPATLTALFEKHGFVIEFSTTQSGEHWFQPHNLLVIARKQQNIPASFKLPTQTADEVLKLLHDYRFRWRWVSAPRWYLWYELNHLRKFAFRGLRRIKRSLSESPTL